MGSRIAIGLSVVAVLAAVLFYALSERPIPVGSEHRPAEVTIRSAQHGFPPASTDERPPVSPTFRSVELCGYGQISVTPQDQQYPAQVRAAARDTLVRITDSLASDPDHGLRAVALSLSATMKGVAAGESFTARQPPDCGESPECMRRLLEAHAAAKRVDTDQLAASVVATGSGRAYATALYACDKAYFGHGRSGPCARLSAAQWAALEPDNVIPWLVEAGRASAAGDRTAQEAALRGAARAKSSRLYEGGPIILANHPELAKAPPAVRMAALTDLVGIYAAVPLPPLLGAAQHCGRGVAMDDARRRECTAIAEALLTGSSLLEISLGTAFGRNAGWPEVKVHPLQDRIDAIKQATSRQIWDTDDFWSCGFLDALQGQASRLARTGEVGAAEHAIKETGRSVSELAQQWRDREKAWKNSADESRR